RPPVLGLLSFQVSALVNAARGLVGEGFEQLHVSFGERRRRKITPIASLTRSSETRSMVWQPRHKSRCPASGRGRGSFATREITREDDYKTPINPGSRGRTLLLPRAAEERRRCRLAQGSWRAIRACTIRPIDRRCSRSF